MTLPHELESDDYWAAFNWVLEDPGARPSNYSRPMFEIQDDGCHWQQGDCDCIDCEPRVRPAR